MANKNIEGFFEELKKNEKAMELIRAGKAETLEDLAKVTGGVASQLGYDLSEDEFIAFFNQQESAIKWRSDVNAQGITNITEALLSGDSAKSCGARQEALTPYCRFELRKM